MTRRRVIILAVVYLLCGFVVNVLVAWGCAARPGAVKEVTVHWGLTPDGTFMAAEIERRLFADSYQMTRAPGIIDSPDSPTSDLTRSFEQYLRDGESPFSLHGAWSIQPDGTRVPAELEIRRLLAPEPPVMPPPLSSPTHPALARLLPAWMRSELNTVSRQSMFSSAGWPFRSMCAIEHELSNTLGVVARRAPLRPIWSGTLYNVLIYGSILGIAHQCLLFSTRRWRRVQRGLCPECAYDLRGAPAGGCPECGWDRAKQ